MLDEDGDNQAQEVHLVVSSDVLSVGQLLSLLKSPPDYVCERGAVRTGALVRRPAPENVWKISEVGSRGSYIDTLMSRLMVRIREIRSDLFEAKRLGCSLKIEIVQYVFENASLGIVFEAEDLLMLGEIGAFIDLDQYLE